MTTRGVPLSKVRDLGLLVLLGMKFSNSFVLGIIPLTIPSTQIVLDLTEKSFEIRLADSRTFYLKASSYLLRELMLIFQLMFTYST